MSSSRRVDITDNVYVSVFEDGRIELCAPHPDPRPGRGSHYRFIVEERPDIPEQTDE
jgi:hypothetical protein